MKAIRVTIILAVTMLGSTGCTPGETGSAVPSDEVHPQPTAIIKAFPSETATSLPVPTATSVPPTRTPIPTTSPYDKIPEQTGDGWQTASLVDAGIDPVRINKMLDTIYHGEGQGDTLTMPNGSRKVENIHSILIVKKGYLVFEEYFDHYTRYSSHDLASVTKSITSLLVGLAIEQGYFGGVQDKILAYFPEYLPLQQQDNGKESITIENLLTMRHGMECDDWDPASRSYYQKNQPNRPDEIHYILNIPMETLPGSHFSYCTWGTTVLNAMLIQATGMELPMFAKQFLFQPLGINSVLWNVTSGDWKNIDGVALMRPRDMAKIGQMMLQNGKWDGQQIIPEAWIEQSTREWISLPFNVTWGKGYGYLWWLSDVLIAGSPVHSFAASGHGGQVIAIFPKMEMVIVITGGNYENDESQPFEIMQEFILPAVLLH